MREYRIYIFLFSAVKCCLKLSDILDNVLTLDVYLIAARIRDPTETWVQGCTLALALKTRIYKTVSPTLTVDRKDV